jgi:hypothetical protein
MYFKLKTIFQQTYFVFGLDGVGPFEQLDKTAAAVTVDRNLRRLICNIIVLEVKKVALILHHLKISEVRKNRTRFSIIRSEIMSVYGRQVPMQAGPRPEKGVELRANDQV